LESILKGKNMFSIKVIKVLTACLVTMIMAFSLVVEAKAEVDNTIAGIDNITAAPVVASTPQTVTLNDGAVVSIEEYEKATGKKYNPEETNNSSTQVANTQTTTAGTQSGNSSTGSSSTTSNAALLTVDLVIFSGQSNMSGDGGDVKLAPAVPNKHGYEFRNGKDPAGLYTVVEPFGTSADGYLCDPDGLRSGTLVSSFMNSYYAKTGVPVMGVSAARAGTSVNYWNEPEVQADLLRKYQNAKDWCAANNVKIRHQYIVWLQGETDAIAKMDGGTYQELVKSAFASVINQGIEQVFVVTIGNFAGLPGAYDTIVEAEKNLCLTDSHYTLGTDVLHTLPESYLVDGVHYNQTALNMAGKATGEVAASFTALFN